MDRVLQAIATDSRLCQFRVEQFSDRIEIAQPCYCRVVVLRTAGSYCLEVRFGSAKRKTAVLWSFAATVSGLAFTPGIAFFAGAWLASFILALCALSFAYDRYRIDFTTNTEAIVKEILERGGAS